jgi:hypothetical protein
MEGQLPNFPPAVPPPPAASPTPSPVAPAAPVAKKGANSILLAILGVMTVGGVAFVGLTFWQKGLLGGLLSKPTPTPTLAPELTPALDPTAGWKTYTNLSGRYSFKYPSEWYLKEDKTSVEVSNFDQSEPIGTESGKVIFKVELYSKDLNNLTPKLWLDQETKKCQTGGCSPAVPTFIRDLQIAGQPAIETDYQLPGLLEGKGTSYFVSYLNQLYHMRFQTGRREDNLAGTEVEKTFEQILATFEFLTPTPTGTQAKGGITQGTPVKIKSIYLVSPTKGPLVIKGTVESGWMFEGIMPVKLLDASRAEITSSSAKETVPGSWQSGKAVEFSVELTFTTDATSGFLVFQNDNPSGLPENQKSFELPVKFRQ